VHSVSGKINYGGLKHNSLFLGLVLPSGGWQSLIIKELSRVQNKNCRNNPLKFSQPRFISFPQLFSVFGLSLKNRCFSNNQFKKYILFVLIYNVLIIRLTIVLSSFLRIKCLNYFRPNIRHNYSKMTLKSFPNTRLGPYVTKLFTAVIKVS
jgi:hypothetical protein